MIAALAVDMQVRVIGPDVYGRDLTQMHGIVTDVDGDTVSVELVAWPGQFVRFPASSITVDDGANDHSVRSAESDVGGAKGTALLSQPFAGATGHQARSTGILAIREGRTA